MQNGSYCIGLQQSIYTGDLFWVSGEVQPKSEYSLSSRLIYRKGTLLGLAVVEDQKLVLKHLPVALPKPNMGLVFWVSIVGGSLNNVISHTYVCPNYGRCRLVSLSRSCDIIFACVCWLIITLTNARSSLEMVRASNFSRTHVCVPP